jgi:hypothetical protein
MTSERVAVTRRIAASADELFAIVSSPTGHVDIDGSGMLVAAPDARPLTAVGETFDMDMDREPLGDFPEMGKYQVRNTVTQFVPGRLFEWTVGGVDRPPIGHLYGWQLEPVNDHETDVTNYCDWTAIPDDVKTRVQWPIVPVTMLEQSVEKLERVATTR